MRIRDNLFGPDHSENEPSLELVISENEDKILNLIYGMTSDYHLAQDLTQETFIKAFKSIKSFSGKSKISTWLYRIAVNLTIDHKRKRCVQTEHPADEIESKISYEKTCSDPDSQCQKNTVKDILYNTIAQLPEQQREDNRVFDAEKKEKAVMAVADICFKCGDKHSDECPVAKALAAVKAIPTT
ncbi:MAG: sigma-70 family RNA polymerase sigma factor [Eubacteriales bacterium]